VGATGSDYVTEGAPVEYLTAEPIHSDAILAMATVNTPQHVLTGSEDNVTNSLNHRGRVEWVAHRGVL
jgi:hypothetical protein